MESKTIGWILIGVLLLSVLLVGFGKSNSITGNAVSGKLDTTGWTDNEKMNYEMHGTIPARFGQGGSAGASMVGGC